ncbi:MAG: ABC transporter ATP-binding protein [Candidatus Hydrogenedentes bacterium]|nr:ABC transporter ATP-binding protein [Candidatus Hydrogenedentota bacterium]
MTDAAKQKSPVLEVHDLVTHFETDGGLSRAVDGVSFSIAPGKTLALVGESGSGKSVTAMSIMRLIPSPPGKIVGGSIKLHGRELLALPEPEMRKVRGNGISMVFQEPMTALNPVFRVGNQIGAALRVHRPMSKKEAREYAIELLYRVGIPSPDERVDDYPHQMSGGMRQRVMIAMALACNPDLLIADEPTTALDVTIQAQILDLLRKLQSENGMSILLITHNLGIVAEMADEVAIMYAGRIAEKGPMRSVFSAPSHPYTVGLFKSLPSITRRGQRLYAIRGSVPPATRFPSGCRFHTRCPFVMDTCKANVPPLIPVAADHASACWLQDESAMSNQGRSTGIPAEEVPA